MSLLRHVRLEFGYTLLLWDTEKKNNSKFVLGYRFSTPNGEILFEGKDYSPGAAIEPDSNESLYGILSFLTLRKGNTDAEYFQGYTPKQLEFSQSNDCEYLQWLYSDDGDGTFTEIKDD